MKGRHPVAIFHSDWLDGESQIMMDEKPNEMMCHERGHWEFSGCGVSPEARVDPRGGADDKKLLSGRARNDLGFGLADSGPGMRVWWPGAVHMLDDHLLALLEIEHDQAII
jgi:hypothetical protein